MWRQRTAYLLQDTSGFGVLPDSQASKDGSNTRLQYSRLRSTCIRKSEDGQPISINKHTILQGISRMRQTRWTSSQSFSHSQPISVAVSSRENPMLMNIAERLYS